MAQQIVYIGDDGTVYNSKINGNFTELYGLVSTTLTNVLLGTLTSSDILQWNGSAWVNRSLATAGIASKTTADTHYAKTVDETSTNTTKDKHISNALAKSYSDHIASTSNPHSVTATQVGKDTEQWNADRILSVDINDANIGDRKFLGYVSSALEIQYISLLASDVGNGTAQWNADKILDVAVDDAAIASGYYLKYNGTNIIYDVADASKILGILVDNANIGNNRVLQYKTSSGKLEYVDLASLTSFLSLSDSPSSYSGQAGYYVKVNGGETGLEFGTISAGNVDGGTAPTAGDLIKHRADTIANWTTYSTVVVPNANLALEQNASGFYNIKIGNGSDIYSNLPYASLSFNVSSPSNKDKLQYNSSTGNWDNIADSIDNLKNVTIAAASDKQILIYNNSTSQWINSSISSNEQIVLTAEVFS